MKTPLHLILAATLVFTGCQKIATAIAPPTPTPPPTPEPIAKATPKPTPKPGDWMWDKKDRANPLETKPKRQ